ncbi:MAG: hypothetical protein RL678_1556, partial [Pseudomonadota bacterium]
MCGIVGAVAQRNIVPVLLEGLRRLEYRGYDSCGVAVHQQGLKRSRSVSRVAELAAQVESTAFTGSTGIAHTRWATHGAPATNNAHPHFSGRQDRAKIALVHNGIIENYESLREALIKKGYVFESQTDTEAVAHLIHDLYDGDLLRTVQKAVKQLHGAFAIAVFCDDEPNRVVGARLGCPLVVGIGQEETFIASDAMALAGTTDQIMYLEEGDVVDVTVNGARITDKTDQSVTRPTQTVHAYSGAIDLGPYRHYMQKEIFEQPSAISDTLEGILGFAPDVFGAGASQVFSSIDSIQILACGTSYYSGMTARYWLESIAGIPTQVEIASEYRYREPAVNPNAL